MLSKKSKFNELKKYLPLALAIASTHHLGQAKDTQLQQSKSLLPALLVQSSRFLLPQFKFTILHI